MINLIRDNIFKMENETNIYDYSYKGFYFWENMRFQVFTSILQNEKIHKKHSVNASKNILTNFKVISYLLIQFVFKTIPNIKSKSILFFEHGRKVFENGSYKDIYVDEIMDVINLPKGNKIKYSPDGKYNHPQYRGGLNFDFFFLLVKLLFPFLGKFNGVVETEEFIKFKNILSSYNIKIDNLDEIVKRNYYQYKYKTIIYSFILNLLKPKIVVLVCWYSNQSLIAAAKKLNILSVELQHGTVLPNHFGYNYPDFRKINNKIDYFLSYGEYWNQYTNHVNDLSKIVIGSQYFNKKISNNVKPNKTTILFISQGTIGVDLYAVFSEVSKSYSCYDFIFKPHPNENISEFGNNLPKNSKLAHNEENLYSLLSNVDVVVGVYSTALFEAIGLRKKVLVYNLPGCENMNDMIENGYAYKANNIEELSEYFGSEKNIDPKNIHINKIFAKDSEDNIKNFFLDKL